MQKTPKVRNHTSYKNRAYRIGMAKFRDVIQKVIRFRDRSIESLQRALMALKCRYKTVKISRKLVGALYTGEITVTM